jgi:capsular exopolysaccharide synthesis family protein
MARISKALHSAPELKDVSADGVRDANEPNFKLVAELPPTVHQIVYTRTRSIDVPRERLRASCIVSGFDQCLFTDAYKILSTQVSQKLRMNEWSTLGITSPGSGEGKTLTAINLAISLASEFNQTALLVDADLRRPSVGEYFGLEGGPGLSDYLMSNTPIDELLVHPDITGFVFLPGGTPLHNSSEALGWRRMADLVRELKTRYPTRLVVFDLPPVMHTADVLAFAPHIDAALLVVEEGWTARQDVERATQLLESTNLIGTVLNKSSEVRAPVERSRGWMRSLFRRGQDRRPR